jgi:uncharacterized protein YndB with AHSA1/START domain
VLVSAVLGLRDAAAEVTSSDAGGFQVRIERKVLADPDRVYAALLDIGYWWSPAHTYSGDARNLSIDLDRGWFVERLPAGGYVRHLDVVYYQPGNSLRMTGGLGPLQSMGVHGALTVTVTPRPDHTIVALEYSVSGHAPGGLAALAQPVDAVLAEQVERWGVYCEKKE